MQSDDTFKTMRLPVSRGRRILESNGIVSVTDLIGMSETDLLALRGLGPTKIKNLRRFLQAKGYMPRDGNYPIDSYPNEG